MENKSVKIILANTAIIQTFPEIHLRGEHCENTGKDILSLSQNLIEAFLIISSSIHGSISFRYLPTFPT